MGQVQIVALIALSSFVFGVASGWKVHSWKNASDHEMQIATFNEAMDMAAKELAKIEVKNVTIKQEVQTKVIERTYYRDCKHEPDVMLDINRALSNKPIGYPELSRASTTK